MVDHILTFGQGRHIHRRCENLFSQSKWPKVLWTIYELAIFGKAFNSVLVERGALTSPHRSFPAGVPHSIQANEDGVEFLLVFNQGGFSEDETDLVTELFLRNPLEVLAKTFRTDVSTFDNLAQDP